MPTANVHSSAWIRGDWFSSACRQLDRELRHVGDVCQLVQQLVNRGWSTPPGADLIQRATVLAAEMEAVRQERVCVVQGLQRACGRPDLWRLTAFPWSPEERREIEERCRRVREGVARLSGTAQAGRRTLTVWSELLASVLRALTGVEPHEGMYTAEGGRVPVAPLQPLTRA
jgi:hypothetical protein